MELFKLFGTIAVENAEANKAIDDTTGKAEQSESKMSKAFKKIGSAIVSGFKKEPIDDTNKSLKEISETISKQEKDLNALKSKYADLYMTHGKNSKEAKECAKEIENLSSELKENKSKLGEAKDAADKFDNSLEEVKEEAQDAESKLTAAFKKIGAAVVAGFAIDKIVDFGKACIEAASDINAVNSQFSQVFGDLEANAAKSLSGIADQTGVAENRMKGSYTKIAAFAKTAGMDTADALDLADRSMIAIADSAAFYDRTLEETTETLQSFLKGNYENDAALGLSCTETTRNAAANKLYGKSFQELSEQQKQLTLLQMVEDANELSGAMGQAARESNTWTNQTGNLKQAWTDLQAVLGQPFLQLATNAVGGLAEILGTVTEKVGAFFEKMNGVESVTSLFSNALASMFSPEFSASIQESTADLQAYLKVVASNTLDTFASKLAPIQKMFTGISNVLKPLVSTLLNGLVEAFRTLVMWWDDEFLPVISLVIDMFTQLVTEITEAVAPILEEMAVKFQELQGWVVSAIQDHIMVAIESFIDMIRRLWTENQDKIAAIGELFSTVFQRIADLVSWFVEVFKNHIYPLFEWLRLTVQENMDNIQGVFQSVFDIVGGIVQGFTALFKGDWEGLWNAVKTILQGGMDFITSIFNTIVGFLSSIGSAIWSVVSNAFENVYLAIYDKVSSIFTAVNEKFTAVKTAASNIFNSMKNTITGIWDGIWSAIKGVINSIIGGIEGMVNGVVSGINFLLGGIEDVANAAGEALGFDAISLRLEEVKLPRLAKGGVVKQSTIANIGEDGAEAIVPLERNTEWIQKVSHEMQAQGGLGTNDEVLQALKNIAELLKVLVADNADLPDNLLTAIANGLRLDIDKREFARLVRAV